MAYRILIVDDSPVMRTFVRRIIDISGFEVSTCRQAANGREALELLRAQTVDAILTDINMPEMDGEEFLRQLAQDRTLKSIPVIVISTDATAKRMERMLDLGARGYVTKPFVPEALRSELERTLGAVSDGIFESALRQSTVEVLERMFFICDQGAPVSEGDTVEPEIGARLTFDGAPPGWLELRVGKRAARSIAADFLGEEEETLTDRQAEQMVCELANMICGSVLSHTESGAKFQLSSPVVLQLGDWVQPHNASIHQMALPNGALTVLMKAESA